LAQADPVICPMYLLELCSHLLFLWFPIHIRGLAALQ